MGNALLIPRLVPSSEPVQNGRASLGFPSFLSPQKPTLKRKLRKKDPERK
jgi:hypothetical protein